MLVVVLLLGVGAFVLGRWSTRRVSEEPRPVATTGEAPHVDTQKAREAGARIGEKAAQAADTTARALNEGALTTKIKAKMALDDSVKALDINVDTQGSTVTLRGWVSTEAQRQRALQLARETNGVTQVVDRLEVRSR